MIIEKTKINDCLIIEKSKFKDSRGFLVDSFDSNLFYNNDIRFRPLKSLYVYSKKGVIRGMHFQLPMFEQAKLICVISGKILDVVVDLRPKSKTYREYFSIELSSDNLRSLYVPEGLAHGYGVLEGDTIVSYLANNPYSINHESGIRWDSFGFDWKIDNPIVSEKDKKLPSLTDFMC